MGKERMIDRPKERHSKRKTSEDKNLLKALKVKSSKGEIL